MTKTNPVLRGIINQLVLAGYSDEEILAVVTDKTQPLTVERLTAFRSEVK